MFPSSSRFSSARYPCALEGAGRCEFAEFVTDMVFGDIHGNELASVVDIKRRPIISGYGAAARPCFDRFVITFSLAEDLLTRCLSINGPFLTDRDIIYLLFLAFEMISLSLAFLRRVLKPLVHTQGLRGWRKNPFYLHHHRAGGRPGSSQNHGSEADTAVAVTTRFTDGDVGPVLVADDADGRHTLAQDFGISPEGIRTMTYLSSRPRAGRKSRRLRASLPPHRG